MSYLLGQIKTRTWKYTMFSFFTLYTFKRFQLSGLKLPNRQLIISQKSFYIKFNSARIRISGGHNSSIIVPPDNRPKEVSPIRCSESHTTFFIIKWGQFNSTTGITSHPSIATTIMRIDIKSCVDISKPIFHLTVISLVFSSTCSNICSDRTISGW